jgi:Uma2 family endonuclease
VSVDAIAHYSLPDSPYNLWVRDELADHLHLPDDGTKVEVVGGEIIVSPGPDYGHNAIIEDIRHCMSVARVANSSFPWRCAQTQDVNLSEIHDGHTPDLCVVDKETDRQARRIRLKKLLPEHLSLVLEVTSPSNAKKECAQARSALVRRMGTVGLIQQVRVQEHSRSTPGRVESGSALKVRTVSDFGELPAARRTAILSSMSWGAAP